MPGVPASDTRAMVIPVCNSSSRAGTAYRKEYNAKVSSQDPNTALYEDSQLAQINKLGDKMFESFCAQVGRGQLKSFPNKGIEVKGVFRDSESREGVQSKEVVGYRRAPFMGVSHVPQLRNKASRRDGRKVNQNVIMRFVVLSVLWHLS